MNDEVYKVKCSMSSRFFRALRSQWRNLWGRGQMMSQSPNMLNARVYQAVVELYTGNIVNADVDAIVNAANTSLLGGGGVDGAIHRAAGNELVAECSKLNGCKTGDAKITGGYRLKARHVIHAVGPVYGSADAPAQLASAYRRSMELAIEAKLRSVAFPAISTGIYGYPLEEAAPIALRTVIEGLKTPSTIEVVQFVLFTPDTFAVFAAALRRMAQAQPGVIAVNG
jgi:O-acetyl-ADP-ribose deacetylase